MDIMVVDTGISPYFTPMCITIPSSANVGRSRSLPAWVWLTESPLRLLTFAGLMSLVSWLAMASLVQGLAWYWMIYDLLYAVLPLFLWGVALSFMPRWLKVTPLRYVSYGMVFMLMLASQLAFYLSLLFSEAPGLIYLSLLLIAWAVCLNLLKGFLQSSFQRRQFTERGMFASLVWGATLGVALSLAMVFGHPLEPAVYWLAGLSYLLPLAVFLLIRFSRATPRIP